VEDGDASQTGSGILGWKVLGNGASDADDKRQNSTVRSLYLWRKMRDAKVEISTLFCKVRERWMGHRQIIARVRRKKILGGKAMSRKGKRFPQAGDVQSTLTEKIHSLRIAASEGPIRSMVQGHDESTR
jgi:hypothetical protein